MYSVKFSATVGAVLTLTSLAAAATKAATSVTYVSGKGTDPGNCSLPAKPCRTFQFAVNQTSPGGEVKALDPADYSPVSINKSISITGVDGAGIDTKVGTAITLNLGGVTINATINLANLVIQNVSGSGIDGIDGAFTQGSVTITHCTVRGFSAGIVLGSSGRTNFMISDTVITNNQFGKWAS